MTSNVNFILNFFNSNFIFQFNFNLNLTKFELKTFFQSNFSSISKTEPKDSGSSSAESESLESQRTSPLVTDPLIPNNAFNPEIRQNPSSQRSLNVEDFTTSLSNTSHRSQAFELWRRLAPFALDELMPSFKLANKAMKRMRRMVTLLFFNCVLFAKLLCSSDLIFLVTFYLFLYLFV